MAYKNVAFINEFKETKDNSRRIKNDESSFKSFESKISELPKKKFKFKLFDSNIKDNGRRNINFNKLKFNENSQFESKFVAARCTGECGSNLEDSTDNFDSKFLVSLEQSSALPIISESSLKPVENSKFLSEDIPHCNLLLKEANNKYEDIINTICNNIIHKLRIRIHEYKPYIHVIDESDVFTYSKISKINFGKKGLLVKLVMDKLKLKGYTCLHREGYPLTINDWFISIYDCNSFSLFDRKKIRFIKKI